MGVVAGNAAFAKINIAFRPNLGADCEQCSTKYKEKILHLAMNVPSSKGVAPGFEYSFGNKRISLVLSCMWIYRIPRLCVLFLGRE